MSSFAAIADCVDNFCLSGIQNAEVAIFMRASSPISSGRNRNETGKGRWCLFPNYPVHKNNVQRESLSL